MKHFCIALLVVLSCGQRPASLTSSSPLPGALSDCQLYIVEAHGETLFVVRCPASASSVRWETSRQCGEAKCYDDHHTATIDESRQLTRQLVEEM